MIGGRLEADAEAVQGFVAGWREFEAAWLRGGLDPAFLAQGGRELGAELTAEMWSSDAGVHAGEGERAAGGLGGQLDSELGKAAGGSRAELEFPFAVSGLKRS